MSEQGSDIWLYGTDWGELVSFGAFPDGRRRWKFLLATASNDGRLEGLMEVLAGARQTEETEMVMGLKKN